MEESETIVLGIDPGYAACGYGVIGLKGRSLVVQTWGCVKTTPKNGRLVIPPA